MSSKVDLQVTIVRIDFFSHKMDFCSGKSNLSDGIHGYNNVPGKSAGTFDEHIFDFTLYTVLNETLESRTTSKGRAGRDINVCIEQNVLRHVGDLGCKCG